MQLPNGSTFSPLFHLSYPLALLREFAGKKVAAPWTGLVKDAYGLYEKEKGSRVTLARHAAAFPKTKSLLD